MKKVNVRIVNDTNLPYPKYATEGSSGFDLRADIASFLADPNAKSYGTVIADSFNDCITLHGGAQVLIPTGIHLELPDGYECQVRPRSGLAINYGITIVNTPGTADCDYTGQLHVCLWNTRPTEYVVKHGDRIAQGVICEIVQANFIKAQSTDDFKSTERGNKGHGSTGIH